MKRARDSFSIAPCLVHRPRWRCWCVKQVHDPSWKNQDAGLAIAPVGRGEGQALFAIFDGERPRGALFLNTLAYTHTRYPPHGGVSRTVMVGIEQSQTEDRFHHTYSCWVLPLPVSSHDDEESVR